MKSVSTIKIPFALKNGKLVEVSEVESGLACGCVCPSCHQKLQANKGQKVSHYFSHDPTAALRPCKSAFETSIHLMTKEILIEQSRLVFPNYMVTEDMEDVFGKSHKEKICVTEGGLKVFEQVELEKMLDGIRPDVVAYTDGQRCLIEVAVTNFAGEKKKKKIRDIGLPTIEIDFSCVNYTVTRESLRKLINSKETKITWLFYPGEIDIRERLRSKLNAKVQEIRERMESSRSIEKIKKNTNVVRNYALRGTPSLRELSGDARKQKVKKRYETRSFWCEGCRFVFKKSVNEVPYDAEVVQCPECGAGVSTKPC